jgi:hypothetical protein
MDHSFYTFMREFELKGYRDGGIEKNLVCDRVETCCGDSISISSPALNGW